MYRRTLVRRATPQRHREDLIDMIGNIVQFATHNRQSKGLVSDVTRDGRLLIIEVSHRDGMWQSGTNACHYVIKPEDVVRLLTRER